jgi:KDO2-lipid IV(A) lauroyltransferase
MIDQHMHGRRAVVVDFFGRPAATTSAAAALALKTGAVLIPVFALPQPGGRYRMVYEAPIQAPSTDDPDPVRTYTQRCTDALERHVRHFPELWLWMHRRWRPLDATASATDTATARHDLVDPTDVSG